MSPLRSTLLVGLVSAILAASACSADQGPSADPTASLAAAKQLLDGTPGVELSLAADELPEGIDGLTSAKGVATHAPAFDGTVELVVNGLTLKVPVVAVDGLVYAQLPFTTTYSEIDPAEYGAPDPAQLMDPTKGLSSWLTEVTDVSQGDRVRDGEDVLTSYSGTLAGATVAQSIPSAVTSADFDVTFRIEEGGELRTVVVTGPFYEEGGQVEYTVTISDYGTDQEITRP